MRCGSKEDEYEHTIQGSSMTKSKKSLTPHTSIYISRLYDERRMAIGKRDTSTSKKKQIDPYTWRNKDR